MMSYTYYLPPITPNVRIRKYMLGEKTLATKADAATREPVIVTCLMVNLLRRALMIGPVGDI